MSEPFFGPFIKISLCLSKARAEAFRALDRKSQSAYCLKHLFLAFYPVFFGIDYLIEKYLQFSCCCNFWVQLPYASCGCIPGIGEKGLACLFPCGIERCKSLFVHTDLAPDLKPSCHSLFESERQVFDGPEVGGDVFSNTPVSAGSAA